MTPDDFVYRQAFDQFNSLGFQQRDCDQVGSEAVRRYRRNTRVIDAIDAAVKQGRKQCIPTR